MGESEICSSKASCISFFLNMLYSAKFCQSKTTTCGTTFVSNIFIKWIALNKMKPQSSVEYGKEYIRFDVERNK